MSGTLNPNPPISATTHALLLAAGLGTRFGGRKLLAPWGGGTLLEASLEAALNAPVSGVTLVTGEDGSDIARAAASFADRTGSAHRIETIVARDYRNGLSASLKAGLAALPSEVLAVFVFLGDMPQIPPRVPQLLLDALRDPESVAAIPTCEGVSGHPVLLSRELFPEIMALSGDVGAKPVLARYVSRTAFVAVDDPGVLFDVDVRDDLERGHR